MSPTEFVDFSTPVALIIFNRADMTRKVLNVLRAIRLEELFVIADGPREDSQTDQKRCMAARKVIDEIDWPCKVHRLFHDENLGCGHSPASGLDWVFTHVDECIVLEDDCMPDLSFFLYCQEILARYRDDFRIMMVSGNNHLLDKKSIIDSYFFSINTQTHGWATWKRAWMKYDFYMSDWPEIRSLGWLSHYLGNRQYAKSWLKTFDIAYKEANNNPKCSYWDFQWTYVCWKNHALNIIPRSNLVTNAGYGENSTHQTPSDHPLANLPFKMMNFPLIHPLAVLQDYEADAILRSSVYGYQSIYKKTYCKLLRTIKKLWCRRN